MLAAMAASPLADLFLFVVLAIAKRHKGIKA